MTVLFVPHKSLLILTEERKLLTLTHSLLASIHCMFMPHGILVDPMHRPLSCFGLTQPGVRSRFHCQSQCSPARKLGGALDPHLELGVIFSHALCFALLFTHAASGENCNLFPIVVCVNLPQRIRLCKTGCCFSHVVSCAHCSRFGLWFSPRSLIRLGLCNCLGAIFPVKLYQLI